MKVEKTSGPRRARTSEQKSTRQRAILDAADAHLREVGFELFSMNELARSAGVAKGTLYLYFRTREEVLLQLYLEQLQTWADALNAGVSCDMSDEAFARVYFDTMRADPIFITLLARLDSVIEHNISFEKLLESKRAMIRVLGELTPGLEECLGLSEQQVLHLVSSFGALLLGATQADAGPAMEKEQLPVDVAGLVAAFSAEQLFIPNAVYMLAGIRSESSDNQPHGSK